MTTEHLQGDLTEEGKPTLNMGGTIHGLGSCTDDIKKIRKPHEHQHSFLSLFLDNVISYSCYYVFLITVDCVPLNYEPK